MSSQQTGSSPPATPVVSTSQLPATPVASQAAKDALAKGRAQVTTNPSLSVALQNIGPGSIYSSQRKAQQALRASTPQPQQPKPLRAPLVLQPTPHPDDPIQSQHQLGMLNAFNSLGRLGLSKFVYEEAQSRAMEHYSWKLLADDEEKGKYVYQLLHLLPDQVITSVIRNTLARDARTNRAVKSFVVSEMTPREMSPMAGIYINIARRSDLVLPQQVDPHAGKWLTPNQVKSLIDKVEVYMANKSDAQSLTTNASIDNAVGRFNSQYKTDRRFSLDSSQSRSRVLEWVKTIESQYWTNINPGDRDIPFLRCPMEVGWAQDINSRLKAHVNNGATTPLFGLVNAISRLPIKDGGAAFPKPLQLILFPIFKDDGDLKRIAEILGSVLCSSYWIYGGLNYAWAGGSVNVTANDPTWDNWIQSANHFYERVRQEGGLDFKRTVQLGEKTEVARERATEKAETGAVESEWRMKRLDVKEQRGKLRGLRVERNERNRKHQDEMSKKIVEGDDMMEDTLGIYEPTIRRSKVMETVKLLRHLGRAKAKKANRDTELISELEDEAAGVDADVLEEAQAVVDGIKAKISMRWEAASSTEIEPQQSGDIIDLTTD